MRKESITKRAFRMYSAYNPKYFPLRFLYIVFDNISPYFNLWMSSEIVTALYEGWATQELYLLVAVTLLGNLFVQAMGAILRRAVETAYEVLCNNEAAALNQKTLGLDYDKLENPEIRKLRRKIKENSYINGYGVDYMRVNVESLMNYMVNILFSMILFLEMLISIMTVPFHWLIPVLFAVMIALVALYIFFDFRRNKENAIYWDEVGEFMLQENRLSGGYNSLGIDNRIYRQQEIISRMYKKFNKDHLKVFTRANVICSLLGRQVK